MSVIFPGNYVAHLNAYRDQGVFSLPGVEFYQARGAAIVTADQTGGGTLAVEVLSPDLRQDDKPRLDKPLAIPAGAVVYRTAVNVSNLAASGTQTVAVDGLTSASVKPPWLLLLVCSLKRVQLPVLMASPLSLLRLLAQPSLLLTLVISPSSTRTALLLCSWKFVTTSTLLVPMLMTTACLTRLKPVKAIDLLRHNQELLYGALFLCL